MITWKDQGLWGMQAFHVPKSMNISVHAVQTLRIQDHWLTLLIHRI